LTWLMDRKDELTRLRFEKVLNFARQKPRNSCWSGRLTMVDPIIKIGCFCIKIYYADPSSSVRFPCCVPLAPVASKGLLTWRQGDPDWVIFCQWDTFGSSLSLKKI
jgi:hypothetical protein